MDFWSDIQEHTDEDSSITALPDEEILKRSIEDPRCFGILVDRHQNAFFRAALRVVKQKEEAEDIVQEAFTKMYMNAAKFQKQEGARFTSWAYKIVLNTAFTHYRKLQRHMENGVEFEDPMLVEQVLASASEKTPVARHIVMEAMAELPEDLRGILTMHYLDDLSYQQISEKKNTSISAIKMKLFRARKAFKKAVETSEI